MRRVDVLFFLYIYKEEELERGKTRARKSNTVEENMYVHRYQNFKKMKK